MIPNRTFTALHAAAVLASLATPLAGQAATLFFDDFEDRDADGWLTASAGSLGTTGVQQHNGSFMAMVQRSGGRFEETSLARDFSYSASAMLSFDMHAIATLSTSGNAYSGVRISFLSGLNLPLGVVGFYNMTGQASAPPVNFAVDASQHHYEATMGAFAALAGVSSNSNISKMTLAFVVDAQGPCATGCNAVTPTVWFDNVSISAVPEPAPYTLLLTGLGLLALLGLAGRGTA